MLNLSEGGIFLHTEAICGVGMQGMLKFRHSTFDEPFSIRAEVVRTVGPGEEGEGRPCASFPEP